MIFRDRLIIFVFCLLSLSLCILLSCEKSKQGKVIISEYNFYIKRVTKTGFELSAKGKVKNVGDVDVKKIAVTGNCLSCSEIIKYDGGWIHTPGMEKTAEQQPVVNYLPIGAEKEFTIETIAYAGTGSRQPPENIPEQLEVIVVSFETVIE